VRGLIKFLEALGGTRASICGQTWRTRSSNHPDNVRHLLVIRESRGGSGISASSASRALDRRTKRDEPADAITLHTAAATGGGREGGARRDNGYLH